MNYVITFSDETKQFNAQLYNKVKETIDNLPYKPFTLKAKTGVLISFITEDDSQMIIKKFQSLSETLEGINIEFICFIDTLSKKNLYMTNMKKGKLEDQIVSYYLAREHNAENFLNFYSLMYEKNIYDLSNILDALKPYSDLKKRFYDKYIKPNIAFTMEDYIAKNKIPTII